MTTMTQTKWVRNNHLLGYESSEFVYVSPGYETTVGTKQLVSHRTVNKKSGEGLYRLEDLSHHFHKTCHWACAGDLSYLAAV